MPVDLLLKDIETELKRLGISGLKIQWTRGAVEIISPDRDFNYLCKDRLLGYYSEVYNGLKLIEILENLKSATIETLWDMIEPAVYGKIEH